MRRKAKKFDEDLQENPIDDCDTHNIIKAGSPSNETTSMFSSYSSCSHQETTPLSICWNPSGYTLSASYLSQLKLLDMTTSGLKINRTFQVQGEMHNLKWLNDYIFGAAGGIFVKFWDLRVGGHSREIINIKPGNHKNIQIFQINHNLQNVTVLNEESIFNYDIRKSKNNKNSQVNTINEADSEYKIKTEINSIKWAQSDKQVLIAAGSNSVQTNSNQKGLLWIHPASFDQPDCLQVTDSPICSLSLDQKQQKLSLLTEQNLVYIFTLPQLLCQRTVSYPEQYSLFDSQLSYNGQFLVALSDKIAYIACLKEQTDKVNWKSHAKKFGCKQKFIQLPIQELSPVAWHPNENILAYVSRKDKKDKQLIQLFRL